MANLPPVTPQGTINLPNNVFQNANTFSVRTNALRDSDLVPFGQLMAILDSEQFGGSAFFTSASTNTISLGLKTFRVNVPLANFPYTVGSVLRAHVNNPLAYNNSMSGLVVSITVVDANNIDVGFNSIRIFGSGTQSNWRLEPGGTLSAQFSGNGITGNVSPGRVVLGTNLSGAWDSDNAAITVNATGGGGGAVITQMATPPTTATVGTLNQLAYSLSNNAFYFLESIAGNVYTWTQQNFASLGDVSQTATERYTADAAEFLALAGSNAAIFLNAQFPGATTLRVGNSNMAQADYNTWSGRFAAGQRFGINARLNDGTTTVLRSTISNVNLTPGPINYQIELTLSLDAASIAQMPNVIGRTVVNDDWTFNQTTSFVSYGSLVNAVWGNGDLVSYNNGVFQPTQQVQVPTSLKDSDLRNSPSTAANQGAWQAYIRANQNNVASAAPDSDLRNTPAIVITGTGLTNWTTFIQARQTQGPSLGYARFRNPSANTVTVNSFGTAAFNGTDTTWVNLRITTATPLLAVGDVVKILNLENTPAYNRSDWYVTSIDYNGGEQEVSLICYGVNVVQAASGFQPNGTPRIRFLNSYAVSTNNALVGVGAIENSLARTSYNTRTGVLTANQPTVVTVSWHQTFNTTIAGTGDSDTSATSPTECDIWIERTVNGLADSGYRTSQSYTTSFSSGAAALQLDLTFAMGTGDTWALKHYLGATAGGRYSINGTAFGPGTTQLHITEVRAA